MNRLQVIIVVFTSVCLAFSMAQAGVHKWKDEKGQTWITDYPGPDKAKKSKEEKETDSGKRPDEGTAAREGNPDRTGSPFPFQQPDMTDLPGDIQYAMQTLGIFFLFGGVVCFVFFGLCLFLIARKLAVPYAWTAWIPLVNAWTFVTAAGKPSWWAVLVLLPGIASVIPGMLGFIFALLATIPSIYCWMRITESLGREKLLGLLMIVPVVNLIFLGILAFSKEEIPLYS